jgi:single-strand DNA-binding protein
MGVNKVILLGNVGSDPEIKSLPNGTMLAKFGLATSDRRRKDEHGKPATEWHTVVAWDKLAECVVKPYVTKGTQLYLEGSIRTRTYEKDGQRRYFTEIHADQVELLGGGTQTERPAVEPEPDDDDLPF